MYTLKTWDFLPSIIQKLHYSSIPGHIKNSHPCQNFKPGFQTRHCHLQFLCSTNVTNHELLFIPQAGRQRKWLYRTVQNLCVLRLQNFLATVNALNFLWYFFRQKRQTKFFIFLYIIERENNRERLFLSVRLNNVYKSAQID